MILLIALPRYCAIYILVKIEIKQKITNNYNIFNMSERSKKQSIGQYYITNGDLYVHYDEKTQSYFLSDKLIGSCVWDRTAGENFIRVSEVDKKGLYLTEFNKDSSKYVAKSRICAVCGVISSLCCSKCKYIFYCSPAHQKDHWQIHRNDCGTSFYTHAP